MFKNILLLKYLIKVNEQKCAIYTGTNVKMFKHTFQLIIYNNILYIKIIHKTIKSVLYKRACPFGKIKANQLF